MWGMQKQFCFNMCVVKFLAMLKANASNIEAVLGVS
jgi:hypothetical protein